MTFTPAPKPKKREPRPRTPLPRSSVTRSTTPIKKNNVKRATANHARAYGEKAEWIRQQSCCVCGYWRSEAAHIGTGGMGRKADATMLVPLCGARQKLYAIKSTTGMDGEDKQLYTLVEGCHAESHRGIKTFEKKHGINLKSAARRYELDYQKSLRA